MFPLCVPMCKEEGGDNSGGETDKWQCEGDADEDTEYVKGEP